MSIKEMIEHAKKQDKLKDYLLAVNKIDNQEKINREFMREGVRDYFSPVTSRMDILNERGLRLERPLQVINQIVPPPPPLPPNQPPPIRLPDEEGQLPPFPPPLPPIGENMELQPSPPIQLPTDEKLPPFPSLPLLPIDETELPPPPDFGPEVVSQQSKIPHPPPPPPIQAPTDKQTPSTYGEYEEKVMNAYEIAASQPGRIGKTKRLITELELAKVNQIRIEPLEGVGLTWTRGLTIEQIKDAVKYAELYGVTPRQANTKIKVEAKTREEKDIFGEMSKRIKTRRVKMGEETNDSEWVGSGAKQIIDMIKSNGGSAKGGNTSIVGKNQIIKGLNYLVGEKKLSRSAAKKIYDTII